MIYRPLQGKMKDDYMLYSDGTFYLFSMYHKENSTTYNQVHMATSKDGVHFEDFGCIIEDYPTEVWAMTVYKGEDAFYLCATCASEAGNMAALKFWKSSDLQNWKYVPDADVVPPDVDKTGCRLDCMIVLKKYKKPKI